MIRREKKNFEEEVKKLPDFLGFVEKEDLKKRDAIEKTEPFRLIFATGNKHKLYEVQQKLGDRFLLSTPADHGITEDIPEDQPTLEGNALQKMRYIYDRTGLPCFADDTGLEVAALNGEPGVYSARYAGPECQPEDNMAKLLVRMEGIDDRRARFRTVIALHTGEGEPRLFEGWVDGAITTERSGHKGFGYDPIFRPDGYDITFAEMEIGEKNRISHRGRAIDALCDYLENHV